MNQKSQFLGDELSEEEKRNDFAKFQVLPVPLEKTVSYGSGTMRGPASIIEASQELERLVNGFEPCNAGIFTHDALNCEGEHSQVLEKLRKWTASIVLQKKIPVVLGGEHSLSWACVNGVSEVLDQKIGIIQIDAHADLRKEYQGLKHSHASVMRLLAEEGHSIYSLGVRAFCREEELAREEFGIRFQDGHELAKANVWNIELPKDFPDKVYVTFDLDGLDPSILPAVGTPVPGGLAYYQALSLVKSCLIDRECIGFDVVELAPTEHEIHSSFTAASLVYQLMSFI